MKTATNKFQGTSRALSLAIMSVLACPLVHAADDGWYGGASVGHTTEEIDFRNVFVPQLAPGIIGTDYNSGDQDTGAKLFAGYQFNKNFALEGGYFELGDFDYSAGTYPFGIRYGNFDVTGWNLDLVGMLPVTEKLDLLGRVGLNYARTSSTFHGDGYAPAFSPDISDRDANYKYGIGLQYALTDNLAMRLEGERYRLNEPMAGKGSVEMISMGVVYHFGHKEVVRPQPAPVAAVVPAPARAAPPAPAPAPAPVEPRRVVFSADTMFDFNQSTVKPDGKRELDGLVTDLQGTNYSVISVTGHADRIGSRAYNLVLSKQRADAVKAYLVETGKLPAAKITTRGVNGDEPVTGPNDCRGTVVNAALILCLQPDRRVEVEVTATTE